MYKSTYVTYILDCITLAKSIVFKFDLIANSVNQAVIESGYNVDADPKTWKYHRNIAGLYHLMDEVYLKEYNSSTGIDDHIGRIYIHSLDTQELIVFDTETLKLHPNTKRAYSVGSKYYNTLINKYPNLSTLIYGVVNPVDIQVVVDAKDGDILTYDKDLVEYNEYTLIPEIESRLKSLMIKHVFKNLEVRNPYYPPVIFNILNNSIISLILNIRQSKIKTSNAHSFHVKSYLSGYMGLDKYYDQMNLKQIMFLYRNIDDVIRNLGKSSTLDTLIDVFITGSNLPLNTYMVGHNVDKLVEDGVAEPEANKIKFNSIPDAGANVTTSLDELRSLLTTSAKSNLEYNTFESENEDFKFSHTTTNSEPIKILESSVLDRTNSAFIPKEVVEFNTFIYATYTGKLNTIINVSNPYSGENYQLNMKDAALLWVYCMYKLKGVTLTDVPTLDILAINPDFVITVNFVRSLNPGTKLTDAEIIDIIGQITPLSNFRTLDDFSEYVYNTYNIMESRYLKALNSDTVFERSDYMQVIDSLYIHRLDFELESNLTYTDWFNERQINTSGFNIEDFLTLSTQIYSGIFKYITIDDSKSLYNVHKSMLQLIDTLTSYNVCVVGNSNSDATIKRYIGHPLMDDTHMLSSTFNGSELDDLDSAVVISKQYTDDGYVSVKPLTCDVNGASMNTDNLTLDVPDIYLDSRSNKEGLYIELPDIGVS